MEKKSEKEGMIFLIIIIFIIPVIILGYIMFNKKDKEEEDTFDIYTYVNVEDIYKTTDKKYDFIFVDESNQELFNMVKERFNKELPNGYDGLKDSVKSFVYINRYLWAISYVERNGHYAKYIGFFAKRPISKLDEDETFLVDEDNKKIIEKQEKINIKSDSLDELQIMHQRFNSKDNNVFVYKGDSGYYFLESVLYEPYYIVYTTDWKKIGYVPSNKDKIKENNLGIYVYNNLDLKGELTRYDPSGNISIDYDEEENLEKSKG